MSRKLLVVVTGPTGAGKTALAIHLAQHFKTVILSADSRQFYREIPIGTGQPSAEELGSVKHYFIADRSVRDPLDAGQFAEEVDAVLRKEFKEHNVVILCGGSGLYINAVLHGFDRLPEVPEEMRNAVKEKYRDGGLAALQEELKEIDPEFAAEVDMNNPSRLMRAIELCRSSGEKYSQMRKGEAKSNSYRHLIFCVDLPREELYKRIDARVEEMMKAGLEEEARNVFSLRHLTTLSTVGYRELFDFFEGKTTKEKAIELIKQHSRNYAKRQLTWWRREDGVIWISPVQTEEVVEQIGSLISN